MAFQMADTVKQVVVGLVLLLVGASFVATAQADPVIANDTLTSTVVGFIPAAIGIGILLKAFDVI